MSLITIRRSGDRVLLEDAEWPETAELSWALIESSENIRPRPPGHITIRLDNAMAVYAMEDVDRVHDTVRGRLVYSELDRG